MEPPKKRLAIKTGNNIHFLDEADIIYLKAEGTYTNIHINGGQVLTVSKRLKIIEQRLESPFFFRTHNSYVINIYQLLKCKLNGAEKLVMSNEDIVPLARSKRTAFFEHFRKM